MTGRPVVGGNPGAGQQRDTQELCLPDCLRLRDRGAAEGARVELTVCEGAVDVHPLVPAPEGRAAAAAIVRELAG